MFEVVKPYLIAALSVAALLAIAAAFQFSVDAFFLIREWLYDEANLLKRRQKLREPNIYRLKVGQSVYITPDGPVCYYCDEPAGKCICEDKAVTP